LRLLLLLPLLLLLLPLLLLLLLVVVVVSLAGFTLATLRASLCPLGILPGSPAAAVACVTAASSCVSHVGPRLQQQQHGTLHNT
jgi:hypothetical protein